MATAATADGDGGGGGDAGAARGAPAELTVFLRDVNSDRTVVVRVPLGARGRELMDAAAEATGVPAREQRLLCGGRCVGADDGLAARGVRNESTVVMMLRLLGD